MWPQKWADIFVIIYRKVGSAASRLEALENRLDMWGYKLCGIRQWDDTKRRFPPLFKRKLYRVFVTKPYAQPSKGERLN